MASGIVTLGRRVYASGLYWENSPSGRVSQAAKEAAFQPGQRAEFFAVRALGKAGRVPQFGLSQGVPEHKAGMCVLAGCLANQQPGSWAGAFKMREGTAVVVVRDDLIVPDGDQFFTDETEARDRLLKEMALGGLQRIYAPEPWGVPGADSMPLSLLLNDRSDVRLRPVEVPAAVKLGIVVGLVVLGLLLAGGWYYNLKQEEEGRRQAEAMARAKAEQVLRQREEAMRNRNCAYVTPLHVWEQKPKPLDVVEACRAGLANMPMVIAGWQLSALRCDGSSISTRWTRTKDFSSPPEKAVISANGGSATLVVPLPPAAERGAEDLFAPNQVTRLYLSQNWTGNLMPMSDDARPPVPSTWDKAKCGDFNPPPPPWVKRSFTLVTSVLPGLYSEFFAKLPGAVLNALNYVPAGIGGTWTAEGVIYEKRN